jgi:hypothetical protein
MAKDKPVGPPPVVANQRNPRQIELPHERGQIGRVAVERMVLLPCRLLRESETDHVRHDHPPSGCDERRDHVPIEKSPGRVAMKQDDRIALPFVHVMHPPAVHIGEPRTIRPLGPDGGRNFVDVSGHRSSVPGRRPGPKAHFGSIVQY